MALHPRRRFAPISECSTDGRSNQIVVADLDGTLLISRNLFPYFLLIALEASGPIRALLILASAPYACFLYLFISESIVIHLIFFITFAALKLSEIERVSRSIFPDFYAEFVNLEAWKVFNACGKRYVTTANSRIKVEPFVKSCLGMDMMIGTELEVTESGRATGFIKKPGVLIGERKKDVVLKKFGMSDLPDLGLGDRESDFEFMSLCREHSNYKKNCDEGIDKRTYHILNSLFTGVIAKGRARYTSSSNELPNDVNEGETDEECITGHRFDENFEDQENDVEVSLETKSCSICLVVNFL